MTKKKKINKPYLLVDGMNMAYRAYHAHGKLATSNGRSISVIYGFLNILYTAIKIIKPKRVIVVWDGKKSKERLAIYPEYKAHRLKLGMDVEDFYKQRDVVKEMLFTLGIAQVHDEGVECDDYIAYIIKEEQEDKPKRKFIILSGDKDFGQLISKTVSQYHPTKGSINLVNFKRLMGVNPEQWVDYLTLLGDSSDNIKGYPGMGEKKVPQFLNEHTSIKEYLNKECKDKIDRKLLLEVYLRNSKLIDLNWFVDTYLSSIGISYVKDKPYPNYKPNKYQKLCKQWQLRKFSKPEFTGVFEKLASKNILK